MKQRVAFDWPMPLTLQVCERGRFDREHEGGEVVEWKEECLISDRLQCPRTRGADAVGSWARSYRLERNRQMARPAAYKRDAVRVSQHGKWW